MDNRKNLKIAFAGVFDIDNYGDHLFPIIFEDNLKRRNFNPDIYLFSPFDSVQGFGINKKVYALNKMEKMHKDIGFDIIVVGGGEIIHFYSFKQRNHKGEYVEYPIYETWIVPYIVGKKFGIPVVWNNPGCPFELEGYQDYIAKKVVAEVDYLSVRNCFSYDILKKYNEKVRLSIDTAFDLPNVFPKESLQRKINDEYIVFHCNRFIGEDSYNEALNVLLMLSKQYKIVLLPLAITNDDYSILERFYTDSGNRFILINDNLDMKSIVSYLAHTKLYIGVSFHGAITANAYGNDVIGYDFVHNKKTKDLYEQMNLSGQYIDRLGILKDVVENTINNSNDNNICGKELENEVKEHFDSMVESIKSKKMCIYNEHFMSVQDIIERLSDLLSVCSSERSEQTGKIEKYKSEAQYNLLNWQQCSNEMIELYNRYQKLEKDNIRLRELLYSKK